MKTLPDRIRTAEELEAWRRSVIEYQCPICGETLKPLVADNVRLRNRYKCYDPPGCGTIFRLSADVPPQMMEIDEESTEEIPHPVIEI